MEVTGLSAGAVARRLGIAVTTLRTWHQRYGLGPTGHSPGSHRRYTEDDLTRLTAMRGLTSEGIPAAEAARLALAGGGELIPRPARAGGGEAIPVGRAGPSARGIAASAMRLDEAALRGRVMTEIARRGVVQAWTEVLVPVLAGVGDRHHATRQLIEVEHLMSRCISEVLGALPRPREAGPARVLLACADEEQHSLPLEALAAALAERGNGCRMLGARVPPRSLAAAVSRTGPTMVVVWSHQRGTGDPAQLRALQRHPVRPAIIAAAGPGWTEAPPGILTPSTLEEALNVALAVG
ncbi:MAG TPA: MerR family transcriptional regulator [Candidatus Limnocylindrales bacterium]